MSGFSSKPLKPSPLLTYIRKHPFLLFGLPFVGLMVGSSFVLENFTKTRYDYQATKVQSMTWEEDRGLSKNRKKVDLREEYYKLSHPGGSPMPSESRLDAGPSMSSFSSSPSTSISSPSSSSSDTLDLDAQPKKKKKKFSMAYVPQDDLENVRAPRPEGFPEWGLPADVGEDAPVKGRRKEDRWV